MYAIRSYYASVSAGNMVSCFGGNDAEITVNAYGGTGDLSYSLNGGEYQLSNSFTNLSAGQYSIIVTDENGCYQMLNASVGTPDVVNLSYLPYCNAGA